MDETLTILKALWTQPRATVEGKHYRVINAVCEPKPDPLPRIMVGGELPRMLRLIARHADEWNISQEDSAHYRELVKECEKACAAVGRNPATLRISWFGGCLCMPEGTDMRSVDLSHIRTPNPLVGTPKQIREKLKPFIDLGVVSFQLKNEGFPDITSLRLLVEEVLPKMNA